MRTGREWAKPQVVAEAFARAGSIKAPIAEYEAAAEIELPNRDALVSDSEISAAADRVLKRVSVISFGADPSPTRKRGAVDVSWNVPFLKVDTDERFVMGPVLEPTKEMGQPDTQGDVYDRSEIERAHDRFMEEHRTIGLQHTKNITEKTRILRSWIEPADTTINGQAIRAGTWMMALRVLGDELWAACKSGALTGFSVGGVATRTRARA